MLSGGFRFCLKNCCTLVNHILTLTMRPTHYCHRWGFHGSPRLELVAKPRLGHREVKLSRVTHWIEKKLCDIVDVSSCHYHS